MRNYTDEEVAALVKKSKRGNTDAFGELVEIYQKFVYGCVFSDLNNKEDAEDLSQEVFIKAWRGISEFRLDSTFATWLYKIAKNTVRDYIRKNERRPRKADDAEEILNVIESDTETPEQTVLRREERDMIISFIETLPEEQKTAITYRDLMGITYLEIADITEVTVGTVKSRISRARETVKKMISESEYFGNKYGFCAVKKDGK